MVAPWRQAGMTYIRYSSICARVVRQALKPELQEAAQQRASKSVITKYWQDGKPVGEFKKNIQRIQYSKKYITSQFNWGEEPVMNHDWSFSSDISGYFP
uniref:protein stunted-like n=1 Tax=Styela clava TaxID=7725 RepID=UPI00193A5058|nr:protein stunted-like [Styela clava]